MVVTFLCFFHGRATFQVRTVICVLESSDHGAWLPPKTYYHDKDRAEVSDFSGRGGTLVLLQEMRAHRMSHFQLLRLPLASPLLKELSA